MIFNWLGVLFIMIPVVILSPLSWIGEQIVGDSKTLNLIIDGLLFTIIFGLDFGYRWSKNSELGWKRFIFPSAGGQLMLFPVWICALFLAQIWLR